ncbi:energy-coupling factor transporter transmembrane protein EcfT [Paenibacillus sp. YYML68]|uniref:energy-coupling factor transporter transmembrane component T family protein n=1 Tax=Paenibacillus sp. YYML68 TaxID=2909250 RepID=UPI00249305F4|nr:energy-coupling factor transporter transmembrane protein EcfT [Paenibacillus sp. YYML68]
MSRGRSILVGQYVPRESLLHKLDPRTKLLAVLVFIAVVIRIDSLVAYGLCSSFIAAALALSNLPLLHVARGMLPILLILSVTSAYHVFFSAGEVKLLEWGAVVVYREGVLLAVTTAARVLLMVTAASLVTLTTKTTELTAGLERLLRPLQVVGISSHQLALMLSITLRFIPVILQEADKIRKAQLARGAQLHSGTWRGRLRAVSSMIVPLFVFVFSRADSLALAIEARGYNPRAPRTLLQELVFARLDVVAGMVIILWAVAAVFI